MVLGVKARGVFLCERARERESWQRKFHFDTHGCDELDGVITCGLVTSQAAVYNRVDCSQPSHFLSFCFCL